MSNPQNSKLSIWHIAESYPPDYGGGAALVTQDLCRDLATRGHDVRVLTTEARRTEPYSVRADRDGPIEIKRVNLPYFRSHDPDGWQLGLRRWRVHEQRVAELIAHAIDDWRPDLVLYSTTRPLGEECLMAISRSGVPIIGMINEAWLICPRIMLDRSPTDSACSGPGPLKCTECMYSHYDGSHLRAVLKLPWRIPRLGIYPGYRTWRRKTARRQLAAAMAVSEFITEAHRSHMRASVAYVPVGPDLSSLPTSRPVRPRKPLRFGFMGGFQPNKGIWDVLDAAASLKSEGLKFELHVWGPAQEGGAHQVPERGLADRVVLHGMYDRAEMWSSYDEIDVAIIATTVPEPLGLIPLEAAAAGAPTIGANIGGIPESIEDGRNGLLYEFKNASDLARQMRRILVEPGLYDALRANLEPPVDTRARGAAVETAYRQLLAASHAQ